MRTGDRGEVGARRALAIRAGDVNTRHAVLRCAERVAEPPHTIEGICDLATMKAVLALEVLQAAENCVERHGGIVGNARVRAAFLLMQPG